MLRGSRAVLVMSVALAIASCTSSSEEPTSTVAVTVTTLPSTTVTSEATTSTTSTMPISPITPPEYQIVSRAATDGNGDEVVVLLDPTSYVTLTDLDIYDVIAEVVELFPPVTVLHIVDDPQAANVVANPEATDTDRAAAAAHYLARLDDGYRIVYLGPFEGTASAVLGS
jgi:hypothetical protein